jgi:hypothetical protein
VADGLELQSISGWIQAELRHGRPIDESMAGLLDRCDSAHPHPDWDRFRALPFADLDPLVNWLRRPFVEQPSKTPLRGLWFGLFNPCPDGEPVADIRVNGSSRFTPDPDDPSWAVDSDWRPEAGEANSSVLADIYRIAYRPNRRGKRKDPPLENDAEYPLVLGYGAFAVFELLNRIEPELLLGSSESLGIAVGFDSGDFLLLGELSAGGVTPFDLPILRALKPIEPVLDQLRSSDPQVVFEGLLKLPGFEKRAHAALPEVLDLIANGEPAIRSVAIEMIMRFAASHPDTKRAVLESLNADDPRVRTAALRAAPMLRNLTSADVERITALELDPDPSIRRYSEAAVRDLRNRR